MKNNNVLLIAALSLIFASCEKDNILENKVISGKDVPVRIRSMSVAEGGSESLIRSSSQKEPEMVTTPVGDGMLMEMTIKEDESPLRAPVELAPGTHFRVIAVTGTSNYYSHGDYIYGSGTLTPTNDFRVKTGQAYSFICISYNSTTLPPTTGYTVGSALPTSFSVDNTKDLLWWHSTSATTILASGIDLEILLKQKLTKVSVKIDCDYNKWKIGVGSNKVSIKDVALSNTMNLSTGDVAGGTVGTQLLPSFSATVNATSQTSNELRIMPKASSTITVTILTSAVSRDASTAIPTADKTATLTTALIAGTSYTITVRLRTPIWARSNIYWETNKLTFVLAAIPPATNHDNTKQGYQGVFFKWGSLVGVSPARVGTNAAFVNQAVPVYVPNVASSTWEATTSAAKNWTTWGSNDNAATDIPFMDPTGYAGSNYGRGNTYAIDADRNTTSMYQGFRGDICQYLGKTQLALTGYRLPTSDEFGPYTVSAWNASDPTNPNADGWIIGSGSYSGVNNAAGYADGTANLFTTSNGGNTIYGSAINSPMGIVFPTSGCRYHSGGALSAVAYSGYAWTGSAIDKWYAYCLDFAIDKVTPGFSRHRSYAQPVRCVKKVDPTGNY